MGKAPFPVLCVLRDLRGESFLQVMFQDDDLTFSGLRDH
jgi:hypothetical protein